MSNLENEVKAMMSEYAEILHRGGTCLTKISGILHEISHKVIHEVIMDLREEE